MRDTNHHSLIYNFNVNETTNAKQFKTTDVLYYILDYITNTTSVGIMIGGMEERALRTTMTIRRSLTDIYIYL